MSEAPGQVCVWGRLLPQPLCQICTCARCCGVNSSRCGGRQEAQYTRKFLSNNGTPIPRMAKPTSAEQLAADRKVASPGPHCHTAGIPKAKRKRKMCEGCGLKQPNYGLPAERRRRWCSGCAKGQAGAVLLQQQKKCEGCGPRSHSTAGHQSGTVRDRRTAALRQD